MNGRPVSRRRVLSAAAAAPVSLALEKVSWAQESEPRAAAPSSTNPADLSIVELLPLLRKRALSARELVEACIARVETLDPEIKAFQRRTFGVALDGAAAVDRARARKRPVGPLAGVPIGLKDLYYTRGIPTTASSKALADFVPGFDSTVWARLQEAGMLLLGKLASTEFAWGPNSPPTVNPWDTQRSPGGSSGGSGAALAARMLPAALGTDTGCSVVNPAAMCGVSGVKGTYGRCSRHGVISLAWSCDHVGPMARRMADCALLLAVMAGHDPADPTSLTAPVPAYPTKPPASLAGVRIGVPDRFYWDDIEADTERVCRDALRRMKAMGAKIVEVPAPASLPDVLGEGPNPYGSLILQLPKVLVTIILAESTSYHRRLVAERGHLYSPEVLALVELGETITAADYLDAQRLRSVWTREWRELFAEHRLDAVAGPTVATKPTYQTPSQSFVFGPTFRLNQGFNLNGFPSLSVPVGRGDGGHPVGLQLAALPLEESRLFSIAIALDEDVRFFAQRPPVLDGVA